jgi:hypothetical protein
VQAFFFCEALRAACCSLLGSTIGIAAVCGLYRSFFVFFFATMGVLLVLPHPCVFRWYVNREVSN